MRPFHDTRIWQGNKSIAASISSARVGSLISMGQTSSCSHTFRSHSFAVQFSDAGQALRICLLSFTREAFSQFLQAFVLSLDFACAASRTT
jgi:hypothetical protein